MTPASLEGHTLGKYRVLEALGRGGMAQVYRAYHPQLDRYVAVKVLRSDLVEQQEFLERFRREAHAVSGLRHANVVQVFDFDQQDDLYYMVMELLEGDTLRARLDAHRVAGERIPLPEAVRVLAEALDGLEYAHGEGIIHRDIKPANLMLTRKGQAVLTDFGIAQIVGATQYTVSGALMGTLNYMAPEQGLRGECDARSDIYSLGIVMYELLTGHTPFDADTPLAILMKHLNDPLPLPRALDPSLPAALEGIVLKALAKDPADRYQTAQEMAGALRTALQSGLPAGPRPLVPAPGVTPAVYSGEARDSITDRRFSEGATDPDLRRTLRNAPDSRVEADVNGATGTQILAALGLVLLGNMAAVMLNTLAGLNVFRSGWVFEIFLISMLLALIGRAVRSPWLLVPGILVFANAVLLGYTALTGRWSDWIFLWMLEPLIIAFAIQLPLRIDRRAEPVRLARTRLATTALAILSLLLAVLVPLAAVQLIPV